MALWIVVGIALASAGSLAQATEEEGRPSGDPFIEGSVYFGDCPPRLAPRADTKPPKTLYMMSFEADDADRDPPWWEFWNWLR